MISFRRFIKGILLKGEAADPTDNLEGSVFHNSTDNRIRAYLESAVREVTTNDQAQTLQNKTIDATAATGNNTLSADAADIIYDNSTSGLTATNSQAAIDEVEGRVDTVEANKLDGPGTHADNLLIKTDGVDTNVSQVTGISIDDSNNITGVNDLTLAGNLTVQGTTTTIDTTTLDVEDPNITLNRNGNDATAEGSGLTVERTGVDGSMVYEDALTSKWKAGVLGSEIELANISSAQTLTNKTIVAADNTITTAASGNLTATELNAALAELQGDIDAANTDISGKADNNLGNLTSPTAISQLLTFDSSVNGGIFSPDGGTTSRNLSISTDNSSLSTGNINITTGGNASTVGSINLITGVNGISGGNILLEIGGNTPGEIQFRKFSGPTPQVGQVWTATDTNGSGYWADPGGASTIEINQVAHGFSVGDGIYHNGTSWAQGQANDATTLATFCVAEVIDADNFIAAQFARLEVPSHGFTIGEYYFLSEATAGLPVTTEPTTGFSNPLFFVEDANTLQILVYRPSTVGVVTNLDDIGDVAAPSPASGDLLSYDGADWVNVTPESLRSTAAISSDVTLAASTYNLVDTSAARTLTLPAASNGRIVRIKDSTGQANTNNITVNTPGAETIDGAASLTISSDYQFVALISDGTNWFIV